MTQGDIVQALEPLGQFVRIHARDLFRDRFRRSSAGHHFYTPPLLGDSISIGYTPHVQAMLAGKATVVRPMRQNGRPENCAGTTNGVRHMVAISQTI